MEYQATYFYNYHELGDILFVIINNDAFLTRFERKGDICFIYHKDELIGINFFNISKSLKIKSRGIIQLPPDIFIDALNNLLSLVSDVRLSYITKSNYVIGKILSVDEHPESHHLHLLKVDVGDEVLPIVCGALNCEKDKLCVVAKIGAHLTNGEEVKKSSLLGEDSFGMCCSEKDLGLEETLPKHHLLYLNENEVKIGQDFYLRKEK